MDNIWKQLLDYHLVDNNFTEDSKLFSIKIYENDTKYLNENYEKITDDIIRNKCFMIAISFSDNINIIIFLIDKFFINIDSYVNISEYFKNATKFNTNIIVIKFLIDKIKMNINCLYEKEKEKYKNVELSIIDYLVGNDKVKVIDNIENYDEDEDEEDKYEEKKYERNAFYYAFSHNKKLEIIKYLIEEFNINGDSFENECENFLTAVCRCNDNLDILIYLINDCKMDSSIIDDEGNNCLMLLCNNRSININMIKYLIEVVKFDPMHIDEEYGYNCLMVLCSNRDSNVLNIIEVIKYFIEFLKIDPMSVNKNGNNCLMILCQYGGTGVLEIIKYFIEIIKINVNCANKKGENCLMLANNIQVIKYLIEIIKMDTKLYDVKGNNFITYKCDAYFVDINILKYLIEECNMDVYHINNFGYNCLSLACSRNHSDVIKYLIEIYKMYVTYIDKQANTYLSLICDRYDVKCDTIISFIELCKIDVNHINNIGYNCLSYACKNNNINVIKYLIEIVKMDCKYIDKQANTFLILACTFSGSQLKTIQYLIDDCKIDYNHLNNDGNNCLTAACQSNNLSVVKYLIEIVKMDINFNDKEQKNILMIICSKKFVNLEIFKYLFELNKINVNKVDNSGNTCLIMVCKFNYVELKFIKYLIEICKIDVYHMNNIGYNCFGYTCMNNTNLNVIKYLTKYFKNEINKININNDSYLTLACWGNKNLEIIKYLINELKMNINHKNINGFNCLMMAYRHNNLEIIKYLLNEHQMDVNANSDFPILKYICQENNDFVNIIEYLINVKNISINLYGVTLNKFKKFIKTIDNYNIFNNLLELGKHEYNNLPVETFISDINPLLFNKNNIVFFDIENPYEKTFSTFVKYVDQLKNKIPLSFDLQKLKKTQENNIHPSVNIESENTILINDFSKHSELLFKHENINYYGNRNIVYNSIIFFKQIIDIADFSDDIILTCTVPKYIINLYILTTYTNKFNIHLIKPCDILQFLKFIDQYPTIDLSIELLERDIIEYFDTYRIDYDDYTKVLCRKYQLKIMYLQIHNNKFI